MTRMICILCTCLLYGSIVNCAETQPTKLTSTDPKVVVTELLAVADIKVNGNRPWDITVNNPGFYARVLSEGSLGFGESYMDGWWDCPQLDQMIYRILGADIDTHITPTWDMRWAVIKAWVFNLQDKISSKKVIDMHYQLGNELFQNMLDPLMMYTCGYWKESKTLEDAQKAKIDLICRKLELKPGMTVLDIGCGWGGFEKFAAENYGVTVVGITLSENQAEYARKLCQGLPVTIVVKDYREFTGQFDRVVSIGMFEHVGKKNYDEYMQVVSKCLKKDGLFLLHSIGRNTSTLVTDPWIDTYIFPGGQLPSVTQVSEAFEGLFVLEDWHNFGADYDKTLMAWYDNFNQNWPKLQAKYGDRFYRMWKYYLLSCAGAFRSRQIGLWQLVLSPDGVAGGYNSVR